MEKITLEGKNKVSQIYLGKGSVNKMGSLCLEDTDVKYICIITDSNVSPLYLESLENSFSKDVDIISLNVPAGEEYKHLFTIEEIYRVLAEINFDKNGMIVAFGGGVIGDIGGFVAATFLRGIKYFIQIPTTLTAQVDSTIDGKCGLDLPQGKNMIGAFKQPDKVLIDVGLLKTLPKAVFMSGMAEVIKYGVIKEKSILDSLFTTDYYKNLSEDKDYKGLEELVLACVNIKKDIVENARDDEGKRKILNFGKTIGHAIEKIENYSKISHGEAISLGMIGTLQIGENTNRLEKGTAKRIKVLLEKYDLPTEIIYPDNLIYQAILSGKKKQDDGVNIVFIEEIGKSNVRKVTFEDLQKNLKYAFKDKE